MFAMVKIGDTPSDIAEGLNAGMWTIGITRTGNETGLSEAETKGLPAELRRQIIRSAAFRLRQAGAHYLAESVADCDDILTEIDQRLRSGEKSFQ
jgi:phosphonoacetaldehyde hydrolase